MAFLASVLVLDVLLRSPKALRKIERRAGSPRPPVAAGASALACFLFIPPGCLAAPCNISWGGAAWLVLFCTSALCSLSAKPELSGGRSGYAKEITAVALAGATIAVLAWTAWRHGIPGSPLNLSTYAAMPLWEVFAPMGNAGFLLLFAGLVLVRPGPPVVKPGATDQAVFDTRMRRLAWCAFLAAIFVPNPMARTSFSATASILADYLFFWAATIFFFHVPLPEQWNRTRTPGAALCLAGAFLLLFSLHRTVGISAASGLYPGNG